MPSPTRARYFTPLGCKPHLDRGLHYEQAGVTDKALASYTRALEASVTPSEAAEARIRLARVHRTLSNWEESRREAHEAIRLADGAGQDDLVAEALNVEVGVHQLRGEFAVAEQLARTALCRA